MLALVLFVGIDSFVEPYDVRLESFTIEARIASPLTIIHLSDLHTNGYGLREKRVVAMVEETKPDLVVITGDVVDGGDLEPARELLLKLHAPLGIFVVRGNWENWKPPPDEEGFYRSVNAKFLVNEGRLVRPDVWIAGTDDAMSGRADMASALRGAPARPSEPWHPAAPLRIALFHSPEWFDGIAKDIDVAFAGHTHGGQARVPVLGPLWTPPGSGRFLEGWYQSGAARMFVSRGVGTSILPVRFWCTPQVARIVITPGRQ